jgi:hypothetical protein
VVKTFICKENEYMDYVGKKNRTSDYCTIQKKRGSRVGKTYISKEYFCDKMGLKRRLYSKYDTDL